jgi:myosin-crossreactive antigen
MAKSATDDVLDALLTKVATATSLSVCATAPTTRTEAVTTNMLATVTVTAGDGNGDFVIADDTSGRKLTISEQAAIEVINTGDADHIALTDDTDLLIVTTCTTQSLTDGNTVTVPAWKINVPDPT